MCKEADIFLHSLESGAQKKISENIRKLLIGYKDSNLFKKLKGTDIWELRTLYNGICYRLFAFWDTEKRSLVVATHGIVKKTQKTPKKEIEKAERIRNEYFRNKK